MTDEPTGGAPVPGASPLLRTLLGVRSLAVFSIVHSVFFTGLMICAFVLDKPQPATFIFGFVHGVMYMIMTAAAIVAARIRTISVTSALIIVIIGLFGPYVGAIELVRTLRRGDRDEPLADGA